MIALLLALALQNDPTYRPPTDESALVEIMREQLGNILRDPMSAEIRIVSEPKEAVIPIWDDIYVGGYAICTTVNAKNAYGAYVGRRPYVFLWHANPQARGRLGEVGVFEVYGSTGAEREALDRVCEDLRS